jgi:DNA processing protein
MWMTIFAEYEDAAMDGTTRLRLAVAASRHGGPGFAARARELGIAAFTTLEHTMPGSTSDSAEEAASLASRGVGALILGTPEYPDALRRTPGAPPFLFYLGASALLSAPGIGICGSRSASEVGLRAASACGEEATRQNMTVISGYARGVDTAAHAASLRSGGSTIIVLAEGISHFRVKRGPIADAWDPARALVISQFPPGAAWTAGNAMTRNNVIVRLSLSLVVVEAGEKGGTLAAGMRALRLNKPVLALEFEDTPRGNVALIHKGAMPVHSRAELRDVVARTVRDPQGNQLSIL